MHFVRGMFLQKRECSLERHSSPSPAQGGPGGVPQSPVHLGSPFCTCCSGKFGQRHSRKCPHEGPAAQLLVPSTVPLSHM